MNVCNVKIILNEKPILTHFVFNPGINNDPKEMSLLALKIQPINGELNPQPDKSPQKHDFDEENYTQMNNDSILPVPEESIDECM